MSYSRYTSKMGDRVAVEPAPACISAITETHIDNCCQISNLQHDNRDSFDGYQLHVYPLYTEFVDKQSVKAVKTADQLTYDTSYDVPLAKRRHRQHKKQGMKYQEFDCPDEYERRLYPQRASDQSSIVPKRGQITGMSKKSSLRLRKRAARINDLSLWVDFTFSDDVLENMSITERAQFSYYCLKRITKYAKEKFGLHLIWKREYQPRKSGRNKGEIMPHFHVLFGGMTSKQHKIWINICIQILTRWVEITGTENDNALAVAVNRKSYRRIENPKHATCYISKYFSKDAELEIPEGESIGRCWGKSANCPDVKPYIINLSQGASYQLIRFLIRKKKLQKGHFVRYQLQRGLPTFLFDDKADIERLRDFVDPVPF
ncbi:MAG: hypothetical protein MI892_18785 [Desulfobacterales bacterium]|nr:hypothetical protein [Desulfobacterales bacterium]